MDGYPKLFAVHENHPYRPWFQTVLACHRDGKFGTPRFLRLAQYDGKEPPEAYKNEAKLGVLLEYGTHLIDMLLTLLGTPTRVYARLSHGNPRMRGEHLAFVVFEYPETTAVVDIAWKPGGLPHGGFILEGDTGAVLYEGTMTRGTASRFRVTQGDAGVIDETAVALRRLRGELLPLGARVCGLHAHGKTGHPVGRAKLPNARGDFRGVPVGGDRPDHRD